MSTPYEWRIDAIEQQAKQVCDRLWKIDTLAGDVGRVECSVRELSTCVDGLRSALDSTLQRVEQLERTIEELRTPNCQGEPRSPAKGSHG